MKPITYIAVAVLALILACASSYKEPAKTRIYLVGYVASVEKAGQFSAGMVEWKGNHFPGIEELKIAVEDYANVKSAVIVSVSVVNEQESNSFWKN